MKKYFLTGLVALLPLAVTLWIVRFVVHFLTKPFIGIVSSLFTYFPSLSILTGTGIRTLAEILILVALFLLTLFVGFVAQRFFFHQLLELGDRLLKKIPLVSKVYKTAKEIIQALFGTDKPAFQQVVLFPFPYTGSYCLGIVTSSSPVTCNQSVNKKLTSLFIPTTPNPTTGYLVLVPTVDLIHLEMKSEDALKYIVSCGVVQPGQET